MMGKKKPPGAVTFNFSGQVSDTIDLVSPQYLIPVGSIQVQYSCPSCLLRFNNPFLFAEWRESDEKKSILYRKD